MAKCWTCGSHVTGHHYTCPSCENLKEIKTLQKKVDSYNGSLEEQINNLSQVQLEGVAALKDSLSTGLSEIASAIEWGFGEISWELQQQTDILRSIDHTLKTPSETKANEWRLHAEELRRRGVLEESEEFFVKALSEYRLDYRIYVGLAETYLQMGRFDDARTYLEKSLPHAPREKIDYKSYSYRLIGHIYACDEDNNKAVQALQCSIELSPGYADAHYDYARYCALSGDTHQSLTSLKVAILDKPLYWYLARYEESFQPIIVEVSNLLDNMRGEAAREVNGYVEELEHDLRNAEPSIDKARQVMSRAGRNDSLESEKRYVDAQKEMKLAKDAVKSGDYATLVYILPEIEKILCTSKEIKGVADQERHHYTEICLDRSAKKGKGILTAVMFGVAGFFVAGLIGAILSLIIGAIFGDTAAKISFFLILLFGTVIAALKGYEEGSM